MNVSELVNLSKQILFGHKPESEPMRYFASNLLTFYHLGEKDTKNQDTQYRGEFMLAEMLEDGRFRLSKTSWRPIEGQKYRKVDELKIVASAKEAIDECMTIMS